MAILSTHCALVSMMAMLCAFTNAQAIDEGAELKAVIDAGHAWLQRHQDEDGRWSAAAFLVHDPKGEPCDGWGKPDQDVFVTSLVATACFGIGQLPDGARTHPHLCRALEWLASQVQADGSIGSPTSRTLVRDTAAAGKVLHSANSYHPHGDPRCDFDAVTARLDTWRLDSGLWPENGEHGKADWLTSTLTLEYLTMVKQAPGAELLDSLVALDPPGRPGSAHGGGAHLAHWYVRSAERRAQYCELLAAKPPAPGLAPTEVDYLAWYFTAQAMQFDDATRWDTWWRALVTTAAALQRKDGSFAGSWDPIDKRGQEGGRVYATAAMLLALEVAWRKQFRDK